MRLNVNRRRARRRSLAVWTARYRLDPSQPWCSCRVLDVSETGIGLELHGPVPPDRAIYLLRQVCHSLSEAQSCGLVHRDIKPANIFLCRYGETTTSSRCWTSGW